MSLVYPRLLLSYWVSTAFPFLDLSSLQPFVQDLLGCFPVLRGDSVDAFVSAPSMKAPCSEASPDGAVLLSWAGHTWHRNWFQWGQLSDNQVPRTDGNPMVQTPSLGCRADSSLVVYTRYFTVHEALPSPSAPVVSIHTWSSIQAYRKVWLLLSRLCNADTEAQKATEPQDGGSSLSCIVYTLSYFFLPFP